MALLSVSNLKLSVGIRVLLDGASITLEYGEHVGMVGRNGSGKSSLMKLIAGLSDLKPDEGKVQLARGATVGYLHQDHKLDPERTCRAEAATAFAHVDKLHEQMESLSHAMADATGDELDRLLKQYEKAEHDLQAAGGYAIDHQIDATLHGVGIENVTFDVKVKHLSGGQRGRLALAKLLLSQPDLLLLDEPTNHLDIAGRQWLEGYLKTYRGAVLLISHDRWLLDEVATKIYELDDGRLFEYPGNYHQYRELREQRLMVQQRVYEKQVTRIRSEQQFIDRYRAGQRARQAKGRQSKLQRYIDEQKIDRPVESRTMALRFEPKQRSSDVVLSCDHLCKRYDQLVLFDDFSFAMKRGDRIGVIGPNGTGKSTLVAALLGKLEADAGKTRVGSQVSVGHYSQTHEHLDDSLTVVDHLRRYAGLQAGRSEQEARDLAGGFLFSGDDQDKPLGVLSGGERSRVVLASIVAGGHNLLVLDEPTNHLDIPSAERLEDALRDFTQADEERRDNPGSLMLITHDRMLLEDTVDQLLVFDGQGGVKHFLGTYSEWLAAEQRAADKATSQAAAGPTKLTKSQAKASTSTPANGKSSAARPAASGAHTKLSQKALEKQIADLERELADLDTQLADPDIYRDGGKVKRLQSRRNTLAEQMQPLEDEWLRRGESA